MTGKWAPSVYFLAGQVGWFACVVSAASGRVWIGLTVVLALVILHLWWSARPLEEVKLVVSVALMGGIWDSALVFLGVVAYPSGMISARLAPLWICALWALFAAQFNTTYRWLKNRIAIAAVLGAVAGPLSFRAAAALGAVRLAKPRPAMLALFIGWAALLPLVVFLSRRWDGVRIVEMTAGPVFDDSLR